MFVKHYYVGCDQIKFYDESQTRPKFRANQGSNRLLVPKLILFGLARNLMK
jgi:hypothetical protein